MLQTNDIGVLFATLQAAYGHQWAHKADAIPVWQQKLSRFSADQVMRAAEQAIERHPNFPPSIGQLVEVIHSQAPRPSTYLPAPDKPVFDKANAEKAWADMERLAGRKLR
ncbi:MAG: hypothetical protein ACPGSC_13030 [Granulosicoccaceae bacterium]